MYRHGTWHFKMNQEESRSIICQTISPEMIDIYYFPKFKMDSASLAASALVACFFG